MEKGGREERRGLGKKCYLNLRRFAWRAIPCYLFAVKSRAEACVGCAGTGRGCAGQELENRDNTDKDCLCTADL